MSRRRFVRVHVALAGCVALSLVVMAVGCKRGEKQSDAPRATAATTRATDPPTSAPAAPEEMPVPTQPFVRTLPLGKYVLRDTGGQTDNSACLVCHLDLENEEIVVKHLKVGVICASCHGASEAHRSDELNIIKPDVMYGRSEQVVFCKACHKTHKEGPVYDAFLKQWKGNRRPNGRLITADSACTDCHGNHAILRLEQQTPEQKAQR